MTESRIRYEKKERKVDITWKAISVVVCQNGIKWYLGMELKWKDGSRWLLDVEVMELGVFGHIWLNDKVQGIKYELKTIE